MANKLENEIAKQIERYKSAVKLHDWTETELLEAVVNAAFASRANDYPNHQDVDAVTALAETKVRLAFSVETA